MNVYFCSNGAIRHRHALRPDEAHACIFSLDDVIVDTRAVQRRAWQRLAAEEDLPFPAIERQLFDIRPERVITEVGGVGWFACMPCLAIKRQLIRPERTITEVGGVHWFAYLPFPTVEQQLFDIQPKRVIAEACGFDWVAYLTSPAVQRQLFNIRPERVIMEVCTVKLAVYSGMTLRDCCPIW